MNPSPELLCRLDPMAIASTPPAIITWVVECAARFEHMQHRVGHELRAGVWPYRRQGNQIHIACDIGTASDDVEGMTFAIGGPHDFDLYNPVVPDAAEALHMIGLLCRRLGAKVEIGQQALHTAPTNTPEGVTFTMFAKAAYLECGTVALMGSHAVARNDLPVGFVRYLTAAESWAAGLPVANRESDLIAVIPGTNAFGSPERLATWKARPMRFKFAHRKNVVLAFLRGEISARSCWFALRYPHNAVALASKTPGLGMVYVCPEWTTYWNQIDDDIRALNE
jgi:hypothetical protein